MTDRMIWVSLPRATFGIIVRDGRVVDGAPYAVRGLRLVGMDEHAAAAQLRRMGALFAPLPVCPDPAGTVHVSPGRRDLR